MTGIEMRKMTTVCACDGFVKLAHIALRLREYWLLLNAPFCVVVL